MNGKAISDTLRKNKLSVFLLLLALAFAYWVWPTVWRYDSLRYTTARTNRFTGKVEILESGGWTPAPTASDQPQSSPQVTDDPNKPRGGYAPAL